jgi:hypothetical protein
MFFLFFWKSISICIVDFDSAILVPWMIECMDCWMIADEGHKHNENN